MTQNPRIVSAHAGWRLGHLFNFHGQLITQMTQDYASFAYLQINA